jgi:putative DNA primase/helicase
MIEGYVSPPEIPSFEDAKYAAEYLLGVFDTFDLVSESDRSAAVAGILTALVRRVIPAAPMFAVTAPTAGTGKTLLAETFAIVSTGRRSSVLSLGHDDSEAEKRLGGVLLAGDAVILLDNIERPLGGDLLCQVTTQPSIRMRPLGSSGMVSVPTHALIVATGNNLAIVGDLKRRVVLIRLDAKVERPELRQFAESHIDKVFRDRGRIITAALTVIKAYLASQAPSVEGIAPFGSFEEWDRMVRRPLCWLGLADPLNASEGLRSQDPDIEAMRLLFAAWREVYADKAVSVSDLVRDGMAYGSAMNGEHDRPELYAALQLVCREKVNSGRAGNWLRVHRDRIVGGMRLEQVEVDRKGIAKWRVAA